jgi:hypothetical protein
MDPWDVTSNSATRDSMPPVVIMAAIDVRTPYRHNAPATNGRRDPPLSSEPVVNQQQECRQEEALHETSSEA